jgi:hypothetical protein
VSGLNPETMKGEILRLTDGSRADHVGWPSSASEAAANWAQALSRYFGEMVYPELIEGVIAAAAAASVGVMQESLEKQGHLGLEFLSAGCAAFAPLLAAKPPVVATAPPTPPVFPPLEPAATADGPAGKVADVIDTWARTGTAGIPGGSPPTPWS